MTYQNYDSIFEQYLVDIALTSTQSDLIDDKITDTISLFLSEYGGDVDVYTQGSYAMGTTVKPLTKAQNKGNPGEYDVDVVLERSTWESAKNSLNSVNNILANEYGENVDKKLHESCERVFHSIDHSTGVSFHVDYVPIKLQGTNRNAPKRSDDIWFDSDTKLLIEWFNEYSDEFIFLPAQILILKRIRDTAGLTDILPSIIITALVCEIYQDHGSYAGDLIALLEGIVQRFNVSYSDLSITVPVLSDDLARKIKVDEYEKLQAFFKEVLPAINEALVVGDLNTLERYFSSDFPTDWGKYPVFLEPLRHRGWGLQLDGSLRNVDIEGKSRTGSQKSKRRWMFYSVGAGLEFRVPTEFDKSIYGIRWQVLNSEESGERFRRGNLFEAKAPGGGKNSNEFVNHETEQYQGEHWIKYYVYNKRTKKVGEIGRKFYVEVDNAGN